jgi:hypothetical protein
LESNGIGEIRTMIDEIESKEDCEAGQITTSISVGNSHSIGDGSKNEPEVIKERMPLREIPRDNYSKVRLTYGVTKSIGNYEFIRVDVSAEDFCHPEDKQAAYDNLDKEIDIRMQRILANVERFRNGKEIKSSKGIELPPQENGQKIEEYDVEMYELKKKIHQEILLLAKMSKINYQNAITKLKRYPMTKPFYLQLLSDLANNNISFFLGNDDKYTNNND